MSTQKILPEQLTAAGLPDGKLLGTVGGAWVPVTPGSGTIPTGGMVYKGAYVSGGAVKGEVYDFNGVTYLCIADTAHDPVEGTISTPVVNTMTRAGSAVVNGAFVDLTNSTSQSGMVHDSTIFNDPS